MDKLNVQSWGRGRLARSLCAAAGEARKTPAFPGGFRGVALALVVLFMLLPGAWAKHKSTDGDSKKTGAASSDTTGSHSKKKKKGAATATDSGKSASKGSTKTASSSRRQRKGRVAVEPETAGKKTGSKGKHGEKGGKLSSSRKSRHGKKETADENKYEPKEMPPNYEVETRLLAKSYALRDQALNEQIRGDFGDAVKHLSEAAEISAEYYQGKPSPTEAQLYFELAVAAENAGQNDLARKSYEDCLARNPKLADVRVRLATLLAKTGDSDQAITEARRAAEIDASDPRPHHLLGILLERKGDLNEAELEKSKTRALLGAKPSHRPEQEKKESAPSKLPEENEPGETEPSEIPPADMPLGLP